MTTSHSAQRAALVAVLLVAGCAGGSPAASGQPAQTSVAGSTAQPGSAPTGAPAGTAAAGTPAAETTPPSGSWTGTVTRHDAYTTTTTTESDVSRVSQTYDATVKISSTLVDINAWTIGGPATIKSTESTDYQAHFTSTLGNCDKHYADEDVAEGIGVADGGLAISDDGTYEFTLNFPGIDNGTETALRDETGCAGSSSTTVEPWPVASVHVDGDGDVTDPGVLAGSTSTPLDGGESTVTWRFVRTP